MVTAVAVACLLQAAAPQQPPSASGAARTDSVQRTARDPNPWTGHILDGSGYLLPKRRWQIGFVETHYGIFDFLSVGTSPYPWLAGPLLNGFSGNLSVKGGFVAGPVATSLEARYLFLNIEQTDELRSQITEQRVEASVVPITLAATLSPGAKQAYSLAARYVVVEGTADESRQSQEVFEGNAATDRFQLMVSGRWRITEVFGLYARGTLQPWTQNLAVDAQGTPDPRSRFTLAARIDTNEEEGLLWSALGGAHLVFGNVNVRAGLGYGHYFLPAVGLVLQGETLYPDFDIYVRL